MIKILKIILIIILACGVFWLYGWYEGRTAPSKLDVTQNNSYISTAYFAGGCFWCIEADFEKLDGITDVVSGFMGGSEENPNYNDVSNDKTGHRESVKVSYKKSVVSYGQLVLNLLRHSDPRDPSGSFYDRGHQYTSAIYYQNEEEKKVAEDIIKEVDALDIFNKPIVTSVEKAGDFWIAEDYHQDFYKKNPIRYKSYRESSGRDAFTDNVWSKYNYNELFNKYKSTELSNKKWLNFKKPSDEELKNMLTPLQYEVTQKDGTEQAFNNKYWNNHENGIYVDIVSGEPLFSSTDKYDSGTGWPSFLKPIDPLFVTEHDDYKLIVKRTEIRSAIADSHLGHIILDGPESNNKIRYCMNSAALNFIPLLDMEKEGYDDFLYLFN